MSKTTLNGVFAGLIVVCVALLQSGSPLIGHTATLWVMLVLGGLRALVGFLQGDTPTLMQGGAARLLALAMIGGVSIGLLGCTDWERSTFQTLSASKAAIDTAAADYRSGVIVQTPAAFELITEARKAQTAAVDAMGSYERVKAAGGDGYAVQNAQAVVMGLLVEVPPLMLKIQALYGGAK